MDKVYIFNYIYYLIQLIYIAGFHHINRVSSICDICRQHAIHVHLHALITPQSKQHIGECDRVCKLFMDMQNYNDALQLTKHAKLFALKIIVQQVCMDSQIYLKIILE